MADLTSYLAAQNAADQQLRQAVAPGPGALAAVRGLTPSGFPVAQPGQGGTLLDLSNTNGALAGIPQPQPVNPRMMGTADPTAGFPNFTNGTGAPVGFSPAALPAAPAAPAATPAAALGQTPGLPLTPAPAATDKARAFVAGLPTLDAATSNLLNGTPPPANGAQPPIYDRNGNEQVNLPPLPPELAENGGGPASVGLPTDAGPDAPQANDGMWRIPSTGPNLSSLPGGGAIANGRFVDPRDAIEYGYQQQLAYQQASMRNLVAMGGNGGAWGYHARMAALAATVGQNNFGQVQGQGVDALNAANAGFGSAQVAAGASNYAQQQANAREAANIGATQERFWNTGQDTGSTLDLSAGYPVTRTTRALPTAPGSPAGVGMRPIGPEADNKAASTVKVGAHVTQADGTYPLRNGQTVTVKGGQVSEVN
jgi:hypothetical protein